MPASEAELIAIARDYASRAYAPISHYHVGAALLAADGRVFGGCNVEHIVLSLGNCAERVALMRGISEGARDFRTVVVFTSSSPPAAPCGSCRQMLHGWGFRDVILANDQGEVVRCTFDELLPMAFDLKGPLPG